MIDPTSPFSRAESRILVVDDRVENLLAMEALLAPLRRTVVSVRSGSEALRRLLQEEFAVVLMDVEMPDLDGFETAALIRARPRTSALPILFLTAETGEMGRMMKAYAQGAIDFLVKPVDPDILRAKVGFFVELYERGELIRRQQLELAERRRAEVESRRAAELEKQLVGIVGHDIRGPLSAILATAQVQLRKQELPGDQRRALERIERSTERIQTIVSALLDFTRARVGNGIPLEKGAVCLEELVRRIVDEQSVVHPERAICFEARQTRVLGEWDGGRLSQVVSNLLDNALKYGTPEVPVQVVLDATEDDAVLEVHNQGEPIPPQKLEHLFQPFARGEDGDNHARTSLGLGLYIVREIVRGHDGDVEVQSSAEEGTCFRIRLPRRALRDPRRLNAVVPPARFAVSGLAH